MRIDAGQPQRARVGARGRRRRPGRERSSGGAAVDDVSAGLGDGELLQLLACVRAWNAGARSAVVAQRVLRAVVARHGVERLASLGRRRGGGGGGGGEDGAAEGEGGDGGG